MAEPNQTDTSSDNVMIGLCYLGLMVIAIPTIVILVLKKDESESIKFHAIQAIAFSLATFVVNIGFGIVGGIPMLGWMLAIGGAFISLGFFGYWVYLVITGFTGKDPQIPLLADFVNDNFMK